MPTRWNLTSRALEWPGLEGRVEHCTSRLLDLFDQHNVKCTCFVLGTVAKRHPGLVRDMVKRGHEVASHGLNHYRASDQDHKTFLADIAYAKAALEDVIGREVQGYRAASFSVGPANWWAFDVMEEAGYRYSSSLCNGRIDRADIAFPSAPFIPGSGNLVEIPITTVQILGKPIPTGGGFFRLLPYALFHPRAGKPAKRHPLRCRTCSISIPGKSTLNNR